MSGVIYEPNTVIWGKVKGYPLWPAYIAKQLDKNEDGEIEYLIYFLGDFSYTNVTSRNIKPFSVDNIPKSKRVAYKNQLQSAIDMAIRISSGKSTFKDEVEKAKHKKFTKRISIQRGKKKIPLEEKNIAEQNRILMESMRFDTLKAQSRFLTSPEAYSFRAGPNSIEKHLDSVVKDESSILEGTILRSNYQKKVFIKMSEFLKDECIDSSKDDYKRLIKVLDYAELKMEDIMMESVKLYRKMLIHIKSLSELATKCYKKAKDSKQSDINKLLSSESYDVEKKLLLTIEEDENPRYSSNYDILGKRNRDIDSISNSDDDIKSPFRSQKNLRAAEPILLNNIKRKSKHFERRRSYSRSIDIRQNKESSSKDSANSERRIDESDSLMNSIRLQNKDATPSPPELTEEQYRFTVEQLKNDMFEAIVSKYKVNESVAKDVVTSVLTKTMIPRNSRLHILHTLHRIMMIFVITHNNIKQESLPEGSEPQEVLIQRLYKSHTLIYSKDQETNKVQKHANQRKVR